jgi:hypothetical protein
VEGCFVSGSAYFKISADPQRVLANVAATPDAHQISRAVFSDGACRIIVRSLPPFQFCAGRTGRGLKPPPQFGQTLCNIVSAQSAQKVHSKLQIRALLAAGGKSVSQCSQPGRSSNMMIKMVVEKVCLQHNSLCWRSKHFWQAFAADVAWCATFLLLCVVALSPGACCVGL